MCKESQLMNIGKVSTYVFSFSGVKFSLQSKSVKLKDMGIFQLSNSDMCKVICHKVKKFFVYKYFDVDRLIHRI